MLDEPLLAAHIHGDSPAQAVVEWRSQSGDAASDTEVLNLAVLMTAQAADSPFCASVNQARAV
eukprot:874234-Pleurochrysis_carterae.AAC.1